jgi:lipopolysaccharide assembly outer membrane protein LptD (OstA)
LTFVAPAQMDSVQVQDTLAVDSTEIMEGNPQFSGSIEPNESNALSSPIFYSANDSIVSDMQTKKATLYGKARIKSDDMELQAEEIDVFWEDNIMAARGKIDSTGKYIGRPIMNQAGEIMVMDSVRMNTKTKKALIYGIEAKQGEGYLSGNIAKRTDDAIYLKEGHYTTCNQKHAHFYINARKLKVIPNEKAVCGPFNLVIEDVPTPLGFLLGYFPMMSKRKSGLIFPQIGEDQSRGFYMAQGGYYWAVSDYLGIRTVADLYANGSYRLNSAATYLSRYKYNGSATVDIAATKSSFDNTKPPRNFRLTWSHNTKQRKNSSFRANVNITSQKYFQTVSFNPIARNSNVTNSSITYIKQFGTSPFNMSVTLRGDQNVNARSSENSTVTQAEYNTSLPEFAFNMNRIAPFKGKVNNNKWYEQIGVSYSGSGNYQLSNKFRIVPDPLYPNNFDDTIYDITPDNLKNHILPDGKWTYSHRIPINSTFKLFKSINVSPGVNYAENWYQKRNNWEFNDSTDLAVSTSKTDGFYRASFYNAQVNFSTNLYGMYKFNSKVLQAMRHTMMPNLQYSAAPDFSNTNSWVEIQELRDLGKDYKRFKYDGAATPRGKVSELRFSLDNALEAKVRNRRDSTGADTRKIKLIDNANINFGYNFAADSLKFSKINLSARTVILKKLNISYTAIFDPYQYDVDRVIRSTSVADAYSIQQRRVNRTYLESKEGLARLENYRIAVNFSLNAKNKKTPLPKPTTPDEETMLNHALLNSAMYVDFKMPWNFNTQYVYSFTKVGYAMGTTIHSLNLQGDIKLTEKWKLSANTSYDILRKSLSTTNLNLYRDLHCWQMTFTASPYGSYKFYMFTINAKSSILQELKLNKRSSGLNSFY